MTRTGILSDMPHKPRSHNQNNGEMNTANVFILAILPVTRAVIKMPGTRESFRQTIYVLLAIGPNGGHRWNGDATHGVIFDGVLLNCRTFCDFNRLKSVQICSSIPGPYTTRRP
jgi:hypothetical protein